ncbi:transposase, partial [Phocaeicola intestinalis]|uniref:transposase n=1 Tax=Phocaeicola intestinalis TaxID=2762212 RepID=UPI00293C0636
MHYFRWHFHSVPKFSTKKRINFEKGKREMFLFAYNTCFFMNAILYINKTGCQWRMLPSDFAPWQT